VTGKKFDPAPVEEAIISWSKIIKDIVLFGNEKYFPGVLVFVDDEIGDEMWRVVEKVREDGEAHARIEREMINVLPAKVP
jgi:long-subunit acyl-CoA synthetase (AMP-forming)